MPCDCFIQQLQPQQFPGLLSGQSERAAYQRISAQKPAGRIQILFLQPAKGFPLPSMHKAEILPGTKGIEISATHGRISAFLQPLPLQSFLPAS